MPPLTCNGHSGISEINTSQDVEDVKSQYVILDAFRDMLQEVQSLKSILQDQNSTNVHLTPSEDTGSSRTTSDYYNTPNNGMMKSIYDNIPQYNRDRDI